MFYAVLRNSVSFESGAKPLRKKNRSHRSLSLNVCVTSYSDALLQSLIAKTSAQKERARSIPNSLSLRPLFQKSVVLVSDSNWKRERERVRGI